MLFTVNKNSPFQLLQHILTFQTFSYSVLILKCFQKVFKKFLAFFIVWYEMFTTSLQQFQFANQSMTFSISLVTSHRQARSAIWTMDRVYVLQFTPGQTTKRRPSLKPFLDVKTHEKNRVFVLWFTSCQTTKQRPSPKRFVKCRQTRKG